LRDQTLNNLHFLYFCATKYKLFYFFTITQLQITMDENVDYIYNPVQKEQVRTQSEQMYAQVDAGMNQKIPPSELRQEPKAYSTSLSELDQLDYLNRNQGEYTKIEAVDNAYPNILEKPLFVATVPETGVLGPSPISNVNVNPRTKAQTDLAAHQRLIDAENRKLQNMTLKNFGQKIATSWLDIINDLLNVSSGSDLIEIFTKEDRLLSIGILCVIISIFFVFFNKID
jgi:hypothetical protein